MAEYSEIKVLSILEGIRKNVGMYLGDTQTPNHIFNELIDNALDEASAGFCKEIYVSLEDDNTKLIVQDTGRGYPNHRNAEGVHDIVTSCTQIHSSGKFDKDAYAISIGKHGVGTTACVAVSDFYKIESIRDGVLTIATFNNTVLESGDVVQSKTTEHSGTKVTVIPSAEIFQSTKFDISGIMSRLELAVTFCPYAKIYFNGTEVKPLTQKDLAPRIDTRMIEVESKFTKVINDKLSTESSSKSIEESMLLKFGYVSSSVKTDINRGSVNLLRVDFGSHIRAFEKAIIEAWQSIVDAETLAYLQPTDYLTGLSGFILVNLAEPSYTSQTKEALAGSVKDFNDLINAIKPKIIKELKADKKLLEKLLIKFKDYRRHINQMSSSKYLDEVIIMGDSSGTTNRKLDTVSKLIDCTSKSRKDTELFLVEGNSAGGNLLPFRDKVHHAVLPLRGKVKNIIDMDVKSIVNNLEMRSLINALGTGCLHKEDPSRIRYDKIVIETDFDEDGHAIRALLIGALTYLCPKTIEAGHVYVCEAPLFGQHHDGKFYPYWKYEDIKFKEHFDRYKGLGSMEPDELAQISFDKNHRKLYQVQLDDAFAVLDTLRSTEKKRRILMENNVLT